MTLPPLDTTRYRKVVLAGIDARGGPEHSDPFEMYDIPLEGAEVLADHEVAARVDAVWAFWCKQRDHPKYRGTVTAMLALHPEIAGPMADRRARAAFAERAREVRAERDADRWVELDAALRRLVERFGAVPPDKLDGLRRVGAAHGLAPDEVEARIRRHRIAGGTTPLPAVPEEVYRRVVADLDELARLDGRDRVGGLHAVLGVAPEAPRERVVRARDELATANRSRRPDRRRALVDDLLAAVATLLVHGDPDRYLDRLARDVTDLLRAEVAAVVLVEDTLPDPDRARLMARARALGLDPARAADVVSALAEQCAPGVSDALPACPPDSLTPGDRNATSSARPGAPAAAPAPTAPAPAAAPAPTAGPAPTAELVDELRVLPLGRRVRLLFDPREDTRIHRLAPGSAPPPRGSNLGDVAADATAVPAMGPGLAVDRRPGPGITHYVAVTAGRCGASVPFVGLDPVTDVHRAAGRLRWTWPPGCTETVVALRPDATPEAVDDARATTRKVTNSRYEIDGGVPVDDGVHAAVFACARRDGRLLVATIGTPG